MNRIPSIASDLSPSSIVDAPYVLGLGGTTRAGSSSERALAFTLAAAAAQGAKTQMLSGADLMLPTYEVGAATRCHAAQNLLGEVERADALIIASPCYHGSISGVLKNAIDYIEELRDSARPYLDGRAVGCIACAYGWQGSATTLATLRTIVHSLRGWPTPLGVAVNSSAGVFDAHGDVVDPAVAAQLRQVGRQVVAFANAWPAVA